MPRDRAVQVNDPTGIVATTVTPGRRSIWAPAQRCESRPARGPGRRSPPGPAHVTRYSCRMKSKWQPRPVYCFAFFCPVKCLHFRDHLRWRINVFRSSRIIFSKSQKQICKTSRLGTAQQQRASLLHRPVQQQSCWERLHSLGHLLSGFCQTCWYFWDLQVQTLNVPHLSTSRYLYA